MIKQVLLAAVVLKGEQRPQTIVFETFEAFCKYRNQSNNLVQYTIQEVVFYADDSADSV